MKLKKIKIMARTYEIIWLDDEHAYDANVRGKHQESWGHYRIKLAKKSKTSLEDLIHEILHSIVFQTHINTKDFETDGGCAPAVDIIAEQLLGVIRENRINLLEDLEP